MDWLNEKLVKEAKPGVHHDRYGLFLTVLPDGWRYWSWQDDGRLPPVRIGSHPRVKLKQARSLALRFGGAISRGVGPGDLGWPPGPTFKQVTEAMISFLSRRRVRNVDGWEDVYRRHIYPRVGDMLVDDITEWHLMWCLEPAWKKHPDLARLILDRVCDTMNWAEYENCWRWDPIRKGRLVFCMDNVL